MIETTHRLAGITFCTRSDVPLRSLAARPLSLFQVGAEQKPQVEHHLQRLPLPALTLPAPAGQERARIVQGAHLKEGALEGPLLRAPAVRDWLRRALDRPTPPVICLSPYQAIGADFERRRLTYFYTASPPPDAEEGGPPPFSRQQRLLFNPRQAPPLPAAERERFARAVHFTAPEEVDHPLLRAPAVRARLHDDLDRGRQVGISAQAGGLLLWTVGQDLVDFYYALGVEEEDELQVAGNYQRIFCALLPDLGGLPLHSAGLIRDGRAVLFLAPDEGGKTTALRLAPDGHLLNDDQVIVRRQGLAGAEIVAHATPFGQLTDGPGQAPLGGLFVLHQAPEFALAPLRPADLVKTLWDEHRHYTVLLPRRLRTWVLDLFYDMCHRVPVYRLSFPKDYIDWEAIDAALA